MFEKYLGFIKNLFGVWKKTCTKCEGEGITECDCSRSTREIQCHHCHGRGKVKENVNREVYTASECSTCNGDKVVHCTKCSGHGTTPDGLVCTRCQGRQLNTCSTCNGKGAVETAVTNMEKISKECPKCMGVGKIDCPHCGPDHLRKCKECSGSGEKFDSLKLFIMSIFLVAGYSVVGSIIPLFVTLIVIVALPAIAIKIYEIFVESKLKKDE